MEKKFTVSKNSVGFEVILSDTVKVIPLPKLPFHIETLYTLSETHQVVLHWKWIRNGKKDIEKLALDYFEKKGFEIKAS